MRPTFKIMGVLAVAIAVATLATACNPPDNVIAGAGSDTIFDVMGAITNSYTGGSASGGDTVKNVPPTLSPGSEYKVPGAASTCTDGKTYNDGNPPPNGSGAGITAISGADGSNGCIDWARSSRAKRSTDLASLDFWAFAKDAVTWSSYSGGCGSTCAPTALTTPQLKGIFLCDQGSGALKTPKFTNWSQVGGKNATIKRYVPQISSGTWSFFETQILGLTTAQQNVLDDSQCAVKPTRIQENNGNLVPSADRPTAIYPYSFAQFTAQDGDPLPSSTRGGAILGGVNGVAATTANIRNNTFLGTRLVFNITRQGSPDLARTLNFVGVRPSSSGGNGFVCGNSTTVNNLIQEYGFVLLPLGAAGSGLPSSRCRKNPTSIPAG